MVLSHPFTPRQQNTSQYKITFQEPNQQGVDEFAYSPASSAFQPYPFSLPSSTFNSLSSERVASPSAIPEDTYQNY